MTQLVNYKVVNADQLDADLSSVADAIREQGGTSAALAFPQDFVGQVAQLGEKRFDDGQQAAYDAFWDTFQQNGSRTHYRYGFSGYGWTEALFHPKYDIIPTGNATGMFYDAKIAGDLVELMDGKTLDFSRVTAAGSMFANATNITRLGLLDFSGVTAALGLFDFCWSLKTVDCLRFNNLSTSGFISCTSLENIVLDGTISTSGVDVHWSTKLSRDSITGFVNALSDSTSGLTITLSLTAVNNAFTAEEWNALAATKPNWTISLV